MMRFPYGLADFATLIGEGYFYVDRTLTASRSLRMRAGNYCFSARVGLAKACGLSTLENYYDLAKTGDFERLFGKLKIGQNPTPLHNRYFTLKLNFSVVDPSGDRDAIHSLHHGFRTGAG